MSATADRPAGCQRSRRNLARTIAALKLKYVVITSVDRDDLRDGGAARTSSSASASAARALAGDDHRGAGARLP